MLSLEVYNPLHSYLHDGTTGEGRLDLAGVFGDTDCLIFPSLTSMRKPERDSCSPPKDKESGHGFWNVILFQLSMTLTGWVVPLCEQLAHFLLTLRYSAKFRLMVRLLVWLFILLPYPVMSGRVNA